MVRACNVVTLACTTVLAAGAVASASDKAALQPAGQVEMPGSLRQAVGNFPAMADRGALSFECTCPVDTPAGAQVNNWDNGQFSGLDGQISHEGGGAPDGAKAADDFCLCEGEIHQIRSIRGVLLTNSLIKRARLEIYEDCNGCPASTPLYVLTQFTTRVDGDILGFIPTEYTFFINNNQESGDPNVPDECVQSIALKGGCYWVSIIGLTDGQGTDLSFFGTADSDDSEIKGSVAKKAFGIPVAGWDTFEYGSWISVEDCCVGCTDLAFDVCFDSCKILIDNGFENRRFPNQCNGVGDGLIATNYRSGARSERSPLIRNSRAADDFVVPPCNEIFLVCYIEGCVYTNCILDCDEDDTCGRGFFEIYDNNCRFPDYEPTGTPAPLSGYATKAVDLHYCVRMNGLANIPSNPIVRAYRLEFHDLAIPLPGGRNYWISLGVDDSYSFIEQAWFCFNDHCDRPCLVRHNPGVVWDPSNSNGFTPPLDEEEWVSTADINIDNTIFPDARDFAFLIAGKFIDEEVGGGNGEPACAADFNQDTNVTVEDIFAFLSSWFAGCP